MASGLISFGFFVIKEKYFRRGCLYLSLTFTLLRGHFFNPTVAAANYRLIKYTLNVDMEVFLNLNILLHLILNITVHFIHFFKMSYATHFKARFRFLQSYRTLSWHNTKREKNR
jgi:hypothetical protein